MSAQIVIVANNVKRAKSALSGDQLMNIAMGGGRIIQSNARTYAPKDTGNLSTSINTQPQRTTRTGAYVEIGTDVIYANIQELGGWIKPKTAKILRWQGSDGKWHAAHAVYIKPQPYMRPAVDNHKGEIKSAITSMIEAKLRKATQ